MRKLFLLLMLWTGYPLFSQTPPNPACPNATANAAGGAPHCVVLTWTPGVGGDPAQSFNVYTGGTTPGQCANTATPWTPPSTCTLIGTVSAGPNPTFTYNSSATISIKPTQTYYFVATAVNGAGESSPSPEASVVGVFLLSVSPAKPTGSAH